jgi:hypothetical protein
VSSLVEGDEELDLLLRTERDTPVRPEHASRAFRAFAACGVRKRVHAARRYS